MRYDIPIYVFYATPYFSPSCFLTDQILFLISLLQTYFHFTGDGCSSRGQGQCVALGYESALPLILLTLQGGDMKPCEFPNEGTKAMAGTGMITKSTTTTTSIFLNVNTNIKIL